jgi:biopolymer transport protein ExbD
MAGPVQPSPENNIHGHAVTSGSKLRQWSRGAIICNFGPSVSAPEVRAGELYFEKPDTFIVTVHRDGGVFVGPARVPLLSLTGELRRARQTWPGRPLELRVDGRVKLGELAPVLDSARDAGYHAYYVFGPEQSILRLDPRT